MPASPTAQITEDNTEADNTEAINEDEDLTESTDMGLTTNNVEESTVIINEPVRSKKPEKRKRPLQNEDKLLKMLKERDDRRQTIMASLLTKKDDDVDLFCRHIGQVLRDLPPIQKAEAKKSLSLVLSDYEIMAAKLMTTGTSTPENLYDMPGPSRSNSSATGTSYQYSPASIHHYDVSISPPQCDPNNDLPPKRVDDISDFLNL